MDYLSSLGIEQPLLVVLALLLLLIGLFIPFLFNTRGEDKEPSEDGLRIVHLNCTDGINELSEEETGQIKKLINEKERK